MPRKQRAKQRGNGSILHQHRRGRGGRVDEGRGVESRERAPEGLFVEVLAVAAVVVVSIVFKQKGRL